MTSATPAGRTGIVLGGLFLALVVPFLGLSGFIAQVSGLPARAVNEGFWWTLLAGVLLYVFAIERRGFASIGGRSPTWQTLAFGIGGAVAAYICGALAIVFILPPLGLHQNAGALSQMLGLPLWVRFAIVTRAAICEETLMRGYGIERLQELTGSKWLAGAVTLTVFAVGHVSHWGAAQIVVAGAVGLPLTVLYIWRRDLLANITAHWIVDGVSVLLVG